MFRSLCRGRRPFENFLSASSGKVVDLNSEGLGELAGWYTGSDGWRAMYTKERLVDYVADLKKYFQS